MHWKRAVIVALLSIVTVFSLMAYARRQNPMLLHLFADSSCTCSDYDEEVTGLTLLNPFRDRLPEAGANVFLEEIKQGRCPIMASNLSDDACAWLVDHRRVSEWKLISRQDHPQRASLYYKLTKFGAGPRYRLTGVGLVEVVETNGNWKASVFDAQF